MAMERLWVFEYFIVYSVSSELLFDIWLCYMQPFNAHVNLANLSLLCRGESSNHPLTRLSVFKPQLLQIGILSTFFEKVVFANDIGRHA